MVLTAEDRKLIQASWGKLSSEMDDLGGEALTRLFQAHPQTKTYFPHFDLSPGSNDIHRHGQKVFKALDGAVKHLDNIRGPLAELSDLHAYNLRVDPINFKLLGKCFHVTLASSLRADYTCQTYLAFDKLFYEVADVLSEKYR
ncbi:hemoglobin subunit alpha-D-like [Rhineura floridana]|uniref:hemoglobin subunit alpha-D-like n=1 Tax=Rhineura floridana TaxID=261503 RepID=UPI002AC88F33|nr:hemoglobin subunit alpha-D-like [Rhineura floridana]